MPVDPPIGGGDGFDPGSGGGGGDFAAQTPRGLRGYADFRNSLARHLPTQLDSSRRIGLATLRTLHSRSRVGR